MTDADLAAIVRAIAPAMKSMVEPLLARIAVLEQRAPIPGRDGLNGRDGLPGAAGERGLMGAAGERGDMGPAGKDGTDGLSIKGDCGATGEAGKDGFSLKDFFVSEFDPATKCLTFAFDDGVTQKSWTVFLPVQIHRGLYQDATAYLPGDEVTWNGCTWTARQSTTAKPGLATEESRAWFLSSQRGRDGKSGPKGEKGDTGSQGPKGDRGPDRW